MSMTIVDGLEMIKVYEHDCQHLLLPVGVANGMLQAVFQQAPVGQACQGIVIGQLANTLFVQAVLGDVGEQAGVVRYIAVLIADCGDGE